LKLRDMDLDAYQAEAARYGVHPNASAKAVRTLYDYATLQRDAGEDVVGQALTYWLRAPAGADRSWREYRPHEYPETPLGVLLMAASARLHMERGFHVHKRLFAALTGCSPRAVRGYVEDGKLEAAAVTKTHREWITAKSAQAWVNEHMRGKA
jgi:hypothetical protein